MRNKILIGLLMAATIFAAGCGDVDFSITNSKPVTQETGDLKLNYALGDLVRVGKYSGIDLHKREAKVDDIQVIRRMMTEASSFKDTAFTTDNTEVIAQGDIVNINFEGFVDGSKTSMESTTAKSFVLGIGSAAFIEGFEEQIKGHKVGEPEFDINVTFPENYGEPTMAGKPARFVVKINGVVRDKDVAANKDVKTVAQWKDSIKAEIIKEIEDDSKDILRDEAIATISNLSMPRRFPENLVEKTSKDIIELIYQPYAEQMGMTLEEVRDQYNITDEALEESARQELLKEMIVFSIAKKEGITVTAEELKAEKEKLIGEGKQFADEKAYQDAKADELVISNLLYEKVINFIIEKANVITMTDDDYNKLLNRNMGAEEEVELEDDEVLAEEVDSEE